MDELEYLHVFVNEFCNQLAKHDKGVRSLHAFYLFGDKRPGTVAERFDQDAREWGQLQKAYRRKQ